MTQKEGGSVGRPDGPASPEEETIATIARAFYDCGCVVPVSDELWAKRAREYSRRSARMSRDVITAFRSARLATAMVREAVERATVGTP